MTGRLPDFLRNLMPGARVRDDAMKRVLGQTEILRALAQHEGWEPFKETLILDLLAVVEAVPEENAQAAWIQIGRAKGIVTQLRQMLTVERLQPGTQKGTENAGGK